MSGPWHNSAALGEWNASRLLARQGSYRTAGVGWMSGSEVILGHVGTETSIGQSRKDAESGLVNCRFVITVLNRERQKFKANLGYMRPLEVGCGEKMRVRNAYGS